MVMSMVVTLAAASGVRASRFLIGLVTCFVTHDGTPAIALDAPRHQEAVRRLPVGEPYCYQLKEESPYPT